MKSIQRFAMRLSNILAALLLALPAAAADRPNVVFIFADDLGIGDVSAYHDQSKVKTPHLDQLAAEGIRFTDAHTSGSLCVPSRYGLMTGEHLYSRVTQHVGHAQLMDKDWSDALTLPRLFKQAGYDTVMFGKWHLDLDWETTMKNGRRGHDYRKPRGGPITWGFDSWFGTARSADLVPYAFCENQQLVGTPSKEPMNYRKNDGAFCTEGWSIHELHPTVRKRAVEFVRSRKGKDQPFFFYYALASPHKPLVPEKRFITDESEPLYFPFVRQVDHSVGEVLAAIEEAGLSENTIVIFSSDNGSCAPGLPRSGDKRATEEPDYHRPNMHWRGYKGGNWEGGHRVPFIVRWPDRSNAGGESDAPFVLTDVLATFASLLDVALPEDAAIDSQDVLPIWRGKATRDDYRERVWFIPNTFKTGACVRQGRWKLILYGPRFSGEHGELELFDLKADPGETTDLASAQPEIVQRLRAAFEAEKQRLKR